jgi:hypothetical protein
MLTFQWPTAEPKNLTIHQGIERDKMGINIKFSWHEKLVLISLVAGSVLISHSVNAEPNFGDLVGAVKSLAEQSQKTQKQQTIDKPIQAEKNPDNQKTVDVSGENPPSLKSDLFNKQPHVTTAGNADKAGMQDEQCQMGIAFMKLMKDKESRIAELFTSEQFDLLTNPSITPVAAEMRRNPKFAENLDALYKEVTPTPEWQYWSKPANKSKLIKLAFENQSPSNRTPCFEQIGLAGDRRPGTTSKVISESYANNTSVRKYIQNIEFFKANLNAAPGINSAIANAKENDRKDAERHSLDIAVAQKQAEVQALAQAAVREKRSKWESCYQKNKAIADLATASSQVVSTRTNIATAKDQLNTMARYPSRFTQNDYDTVLMLHDIAVQSLTSDYAAYKKAGGKARNSDEVVIEKSPCDAFN